MKLLTCILMLSVTLFTGCTKTDSKLAAKLIGDWKTERSNVTFSFLNDNTGIVILNNEKTPFKWSVAEDGTFKMTDESKETVTFKFQGDKLAMGGSHNYLVKVK